MNRPARGLIRAMLVTRQANSMCDQLRQLRDVGRDPPRFVFPGRFGSRAAARLVLEIEIA